MRQASATEIELAETRRLYLALKRLHKHNGWKPWRRSLIHALSMTGVGDILQKNVREALELP